MIVGLLIFILLPVIVIGSFINQKDEANELVKVKGIATESSMSLTSREAQALLETLDDDELKGIYTVPKMKAALEIEKKTYDETPVVSNRIFINIQSESKEHFNKEKKRKGYADIYKSEPEIIGQTLYENKEEYPYRVPFQLLMAFEFLSQKQSHFMVTHGLQAYYSYVYSGDCVKAPTHTLNNKKERLKIDNHIYQEDPATYINFDGDSFTLFEGDRRTSKFSEEKQVVTVETYKLKGSKYIMTSLEKTENRKIEYETPRQLIKKIVTPFKTIEYTYEIKAINNELIDSERHSKRIKRGSITIGKEVTWINRYVTYAEVVLKEKRESVNFERYDAVLEDLGLAKLRDDLLHFTSLAIGGGHASQQMQVAYENVMSLGTQIFMGSLDIKLTPEELAAPIPRFYQNDKRWSGLPYGNSTIGKGGCGPTSMAMVLTGLERKIISPVEMAYLSSSNGYKVSQGTAWAFFDFAARRYGYRAKQVGPGSYQDVLKALEEGKPVITAVGPGHFTSNGHLMVLVAIDEGGIVVNDPYDPQQKKNRSWDPRIIFSEASQYFIVEKNEGEVVLDG